MNSKAILRKTMEATATSTPAGKFLLIRGGTAYFNLLLRLINDAKNCIHLQTYIYDDDFTGIRIADALAAAAQRGVDVYVMADGYASQVMRQKFIDDLRGKGVHIRLFEPLWRSKYFYFGRRLHHKVVVTDHRYSLVGGVNISDRYNDLPGRAAWLDFALYADDTGLGEELTRVCWQTWNGFSKRNGLRMANVHTAEPVIRVRRNDWLRGRNEVYASYVQMFSQAQTQLTIVCSYFLPGRKLRNLLAKAAARGVKVYILIAGESDVKIAKQAERWLYDWLLRNHISIFEYTRSVLHAKVAVCDGSWFTIGSYNVSDISAYTSVELNLDVHDPTLAGEVQHVLDRIIATEAVAITPEIHRKTTTTWRRLKRWLAYQLIRVVLTSITFYYKPRT